MTSSPSISLKLITGIVSSPTPLTSYGPKGSGKSALYSLLIARRNQLFDKGVLVTPGENPRGTPAFRALVTDPPASEREFIALWKLYLASSRRRPG